MRKYFFFLFLILIPSCYTWGQSANSALSQYFSLFKENRLSVSALNEISSLKMDRNTYKAFLNYIESSDQSIRSEAYRLVGSYVMSVSDNAVRDAIVEKMIFGLADSSSMVRQVSLGTLSEMTPTSFTKNQFKNVSLVFNKAVDKSSLFRFVGYAGEKSWLDTLKQENTAELTGEEKWSLLLACCRLGDSLSTNRIVEVLNSNIGNCRNLIPMLKDFSYTKNRVVIDKLIALAEKNEEICPSENPSSQKLYPYGYYVLPYLEYSIAGFPVEIDDGEFVGDFWDEWNAFAEWLKSHKENYRINVFSYR